MLVMYNSSMPVLIIVLYLVVQRPLCSVIQLLSCVAACCSFSTTCQLLRLSTYNSNKTLIIILLLLLATWRIVYSRLYKKLRCRMTLRSIIWEMTFKRQWRSSRITRFDKLPMISCWRYVVTMSLWPISHHFRETTINIIMFIMSWQTATEQ